MPVIDVYIVAYDVNPFYIVAKIVWIDWNIACIPHVDNDLRSPAKMVAWFIAIIILSFVAKGNTFALYNFYRGNYTVRYIAMGKKLKNNMTWRHTLVV